MKRISLAIATFSIILLWSVNSREQNGAASWYRCSNHGLVAASRFYKIGDEVTVFHGDKHVTVTIIERGPALRLVHKGVIIDLSEEAFSQIADTKTGIIKVKIYGK